MRLVCRRGLVLLLLRLVLDLFEDRRLLVDVDRGVASVDDVGRRGLGPGGLVHWL